MSCYIRFEAEDGSILIEVDAEEVSSPPGVVKAGVKERMRDAVVLAEAGFEDAIKRILICNARVITEAVGALPQGPDQLKITFGLKATGEIGNFAITKVGGEANYEVSLTWTKMMGGAAVDGR
jgi:hypothetical protein